jgi:membrane-associated protein
MLVCARRACAPRVAGQRQAPHRPQIATAPVAAGRRASKTTTTTPTTVAVARRSAAGAADIPLPAATTPPSPSAPDLPCPKRRAFPAATTAFARLALVFVAAAAVLAAASLAAPDAALAAGKKAAVVAAAATSADEPLLSRLVSLVLHFDKHLGALVETHPRGTYAVLFGIVFAETGFIVTPFLPGDSLLFAAGAFAGMGKLALAPLAATFASAAVLGDALNYAIGQRLGAAAIARRWIKPQHVAQTERYYEKYGAKTIVLARFVPIVRTFAPFVAGVGSMNYRTFALYNVGGALLWTFLFVGAGALFGNLPAVKSNFKLVVVGIIVVSVIPVLIEVWNARKEAAAERRAGGGGGGEAAA